MYRVESYQCFRLEVSSRLRSQDLTQFDIKRFIQHKLKAPNGFQTARADLIRQISNTIVNRADGVFLWVDLVLRSLNEGFTNGDSEQLLVARLKELPRELDELFDHLLQSIEKRYQPSALLLILLSLQNYGYWIDKNSNNPKFRDMRVVDTSLEEDQVHFLHVFHSHILFNEINRTAVCPPTTTTDCLQCFTVHNATKTRCPVSERLLDLKSGIVLAARCKGLLEVVERNKFDSQIKERLGGKIIFSHRSIPEYLQRKGKLRDMARGIGLTDSLVLVAMIWIVWRHAQYLKEVRDYLSVWEPWDNECFHKELVSFVRQWLYYLDRPDYKQEESIGRAFKFLQEYDHTIYSYARLISTTDHVPIISTKTSAISIAVRYGFVQYTRQYSRSSWLFDPEHNQELQWLIFAAIEGHKSLWTGERPQVRESAQRQAEILNHLWSSMVHSTHEHVNSSSSVSTLDFARTDVNLLDHIWLKLCQQMVISGFPKKTQNPRPMLQATYQGELIEAVLMQGAVPQAVAHFGWDYKGDTKGPFSSLKITRNYRKEIRHILYPIVPSDEIKAYLQLLLYCFEGVLTFEKVVFMWGTWSNVQNMSNILARLDTNLEREISSSTERIPSIRRIIEAHIREYGVYEASNLVKIGLVNIPGTRKLPEDLATAARLIKPGLPRVVGLPKKRGVGMLWSLNAQMELDSMALVMGSNIRHITRIVGGYIRYMSSRNEALNEARQHSARGKHMDAVEPQHETGDGDDVDILLARPVKRRRIHD